jgi:YfiH family protein
MGFKQETKEGTCLFTVPAFSATGLVEHGFTCRLGGVSRGEFSSLNLAFHVGDDPELVRKNRKKVMDLFGQSMDALVAAEQVHGCHVQAVDFRDMGRGSTSLETAIPGTDALMTDKPGIMLSTYYADCVPVFFLDPVNRVIALAHAGWKGTLQSIAAETVRKMTGVYGTDPASCLAAIGPAIGPCCFIVDKPVFDQFNRAVDGLERFCTARGAGTWSVDLPEINKHQLVQSGLQPENITLSGLCTSCRTDIFFSHRKENGKTGRQAAILMLKERGH